MEKKKIMLDYSYFNNVYGFDFYTVDQLKSNYIVNEIKKRQEKLAAKEEMIANLQYEKDLILNDIIEVIKQDLAISGHYILRGFNAETMLEKAWRYCCHKNEPEYYQTEEAREEDKNCYNYILITINRSILLDKKEFKFNDKIINYNYGTSYEFEYIIRGHKIFINIPNYSNANVKNYLDLLEGYIVRYEESENVYGIITNNLDYQELAKDLIAWINKTWPKKGKKEKEAL